MTGPDRLSPRPIGSTGPSPPPDLAVRVGVPLVALSLIASASLALLGRASIDPGSGIDAPGRHRLEAIGWPVVSAQLMLPGLLTIGIASRTRRIRPSFGCVMIGLAILGPLASILIILIGIEPPGD